MGMDTLDNLRLRQAEQVVVAAHVHGMLLEALAPEVRLRELVLLYHRAHSAVNDENALGERLANVGPVGVTHNGLLYPNSGKGAGGSARQVMPNGGERRGPVWRGGLRCDLCQSVIL